MVIFGGDSRHHVTPLLHYSAIICTGCGQGNVYLVQTPPTGVQGNPLPGTMLSERTVHPSFDWDAGLDFANSVL